MKLHCRIFHSSTNLTCDCYTASVGCEPLQSQQLHMSLHYSRTSEMVCAFFRHTGIITAKPRRSYLSVSDHSPYPCSGPWGRILSTVSDDCYFVMIYLQARIHKIGCALFFPSIGQTLIADCQFQLYRPYPLLGSITTASPQMSM